MKAVQRTNENTVFSPKHNRQRDLASAGVQSLLFGGSAHANGSLSLTTVRQYRSGIGVSTCDWMRVLVCMYWVLRVGTYLCVSFAGIFMLKCCMCAQVCTRARLRVCILCSLLYRVYVFF